MKLLNHMPLGSPEEIETKPNRQHAKQTNARVSVQYHALFPLHLFGHAARSMGIQIADKIDR